MSFEVSAIKFSHRVQEAEEWGKVTWVNYYQTWWHGYEREWTREPEYNFNDTEEMYLLLRKAIHTGKVINCIGCRKSARISLKSIATLESNLLTVPSLPKSSDESGNLINGMSASIVDIPMSLVDSVPIRFKNSGKDYCVLYGLLNIIDSTTEKDRDCLLQGPLKGLRMFGLNQLASINDFFTHIIIFFFLTNICFS
jgi:hypothetical protein